ncbi:SDR family NAD(P)-dependent oxidoreductase [Planococcaceae bacterium Storch 2/2-2]|nr:SDR family NAD(P)-dependent oxidoreductase [Planococcaceae bacterium Storch 2/2-2]
MKEVYIVTGASRGIGHAVATQLEQQGHTVVRMARSNPNELDNLIECDVTSERAAELLKDVLKTYEGSEAYTLINNAGIVEPIGVMGLVENDVIARAIEVNVTAPIQLANTFIQQLQNVKATKRIMNISSGAGRKTYDGWGVYGTTKAAIDHFSRIVFDEQKKMTQPIDIVAIAPGIIDTDMQTVIRSSSAESFPPLQRFLDYKEEGTLATPEETAERLIAYVQSDRMGTEPTADVRDLS